MIVLAENSIYVLWGLAIAVLVLFILCIVLFVKVNGQKKRYDYFMGSTRRPSHNLEMKVEKYFENSKRIEKKYTKLLDMVTDLDKTMKNNVQKVGLIRYNPFDEMGGNLCFALALLDGEDNGVVLNGIHSRTGSFTYAKPIQSGVSIYTLSAEEIKAVKIAQDQAYVPEHEKVVKVKFKPTFKRKDKEPVMEEQMKLELEEEENEQKYTSIGDVTSEERELILEDEVLAGKIAIAEEMLEEDLENADRLEQFEENETLEELEEMKDVLEMEEAIDIQSEPIFIEKKKEEE